MLLLLILVIVTGPYGSGKSTLLTLIGSLRSVQSGSLEILGKKLSGATKNEMVEVRRNIGYIFQAHNLLGFLTDQQNVQMPFEINQSISYSAAATKAAEMLTTVALREKLNYYPDDFSGGQSP